MIDMDLSSKAKTEVLQVFTQFKNLVENQFFIRKSKPYSVMGVESFRLWITWHKKLEFN